ncbi:hypothetical protein [Elizabethkingia miricola]|uniref:hypothetical protein n=1 Tax=Elizabethkingia miricola TaxID=172045 RepID=UPI00389193D6
MELKKVEEFEEFITYIGDRTDEKAKDFYDLFQKSGLFSNSLNVEHNVYFHIPDELLEDFFKQKGGN